MIKVVPTMNGKYEVWDMDRWVVIAVVGDRQAALSFCGHHTWEQVYSPNFDPIRALCRD